MDNNDFFNSEEKDTDTPKEKEQKPANGVEAFRPVQPRTGFNPAPNTNKQYEQVKKRDSSQKILYCILAVFAAVFLFFAGFLTRSFAEKSDLAAISWALDQIERYYIGDEVDGLSYDRADYVKQGFSLLDRYSRFMTPDEYRQARESQEGGESGVGFSMAYRTIDGERKVCVSAVTMGSPSDGKVFVDDVVTQINGADVTADNINEILATKVNGTVEKITVDRPVYNHQTDTIEYQSHSYDIPNRSYQASYLKYYDKLSDDVPAGLGEETAYIKFVEFNKPANDELTSAMGYFKSHGMKNLILDMRGNPGGYLDIAQYFAGYFTKSADDNMPLLMTAKYKDNSISHTYATANRYDAMGIEKIVVLVDEGSASASEVLLGAMIDYGTAATVIGRQTYGKGIMQITLSHQRTGYAVTLTAARWFTPKGNWVQTKKPDGSKGIVPDLIVNKNPKNYPYSMDNDSEFQAALEYLKNA